MHALPVKTLATVCVDLAAKAVSTSPITNVFVGAGVEVTDQIQPSNASQPEREDAVAVLFEVLVRLEELVGEVIVLLSEWECMVVKIVTEPLPDALDAVPTSVAVLFELLTPVVTGAFENMLLLIELDDEEETAELLDRLPPLEIGVPIDVLLSETGRFDAVLTKVEPPGSVLETEEEIDEPLMKPELEPDTDVAVVVPFEDVDGKNPLTVVAAEPLNRDEVPEDHAELVAFEEFPEKL